ncbi:MAG: metallophosphoesterase [Pirellulales bacterium]
MRIAAISDQHGFLPDIPQCDLLIIAGDVCPDGFGRHVAAETPRLQQDWFNREVRPWLAQSPATHKVLTWGNHDWCGEACDFSGDAPPAALTTALQIVVDQATTVSVGDQSIRLWLSPWSNQFGYWSFMRHPEALAAVYAAIPEGIDVVVSHQPAFGYGDAVPHYRTGEPMPQGSRELLAAIDRVKPRILICGHIHEGHGQFVHNGTRIFNASVVDENYQLVHPATLFNV